MYTVLVGMLIFSMLATAGVLAVGMGGFFQGGDFNRKYGNKLMRARVALQGVSIVLFVLVLLAGAQQ